MDEKKERSKVISRKLNFSKETGELYLSKVIEIIRPPPDDKTKKSNEPP